MPPVTGEPQLGGEEARDVANHEKDRPPDDIYGDDKMDTSWGEEAGDVANLEKGRPPVEIYEDDRMDTSSRRFPPASMSKSTEIFDKDSEQLGPFASRKGKIKLDSEETYPHFPDGFQSEDEESADAMGPGPSDTTEPHDDSKYRDNLPQTPIVDIWADSLAEALALDRMEYYPKWQSGKSEHTEHTFQQQRARLVHGTWASIENVRKISSSLLVNKPQCEHIADHFEVTGDVLQKLGLGKDFVSGQVLEGGSGIQTNLTFDEMHFRRMAKTFEKHVYECGSSRTLNMQDWSRKFQEYIPKLPAMDGSSEESLSVDDEVFQGYSHRGMSTKGIAEARFGYRVQHHLDEFLGLLFEVLKHGEDLVLFHSGLEGANNGVVERTGMSGEKFVQIHELLYTLLDCYACLEHCKGTEFASGYLSRPDVCEAESTLYYWNSNFLQENASLVISDNFLNTEMATRIAKLLKGPNCALKKLSIESSPGVKVEQEEVCKCRLMIIVALSEDVGLTSLTLHGSNGKEVHELCKSLRTNRVLENLVISTADGPLADNDAMDLSTMLKENHSLKSFTLEFDDVSPEGVVYLGAMLSEISLDEIYLRSRGLRGSRGFIKYLLGLSMPYIDGRSNVILSLEVHQSSFKIWRSSFKGRELPTGLLYYPEQLCIHKTLNRFSIKFMDLDPDLICEILDSLKKNKTLQVLELESSPRYGQNHGDNHEVAACLEALLAENSSLRELKVQFRTWDKCFVQHLLRPLMAEKDGELHVNISLRELHIINYLGREMGLNVRFPRDEYGEGFFQMLRTNYFIVKSIAQMLRTNKTLSHFSMINACLRTPDIREIADSLKTNKVLQGLHLDYCEVNAQVKVLFIDLLVNYNFTLSTISVLGTSLDIETFMKRELALDTKMTLRELWSLVCTTSDSQIVDNAHDLKVVA